MASTTYGSPYVQSSDLVSAWPTASLSVADRIDDVSFKGNGLNNQTASYTGVLTDAGKTVMMNVATANTFTIPASGSIAYELGTVLRISNKGAGTTTVQPNGGVLLNGGNISLTQYQSCEVQLVAADIWVATVKPQIVTASGLTLISTNTLTAVSSVNLNNCFSSTYDNYKIEMSGTVSASNYIRLRLRSSGTDATTNYQYGGYYCSTSALGFEIGAGSGSATAMLIGRWITGYRCSLDATIFSPFLSQETNNLTATNNRDAMYQFSSTHITANSYDGMTLYPETGTITGILRVYGYQNS